MARSKKISLDSLVEEALKKPLLVVQDFDYEYQEKSAEAVIEEPKKEEVIHERKLVKKGSKWEWE